MSTDAVVGEPGPAHRGAPRSRPAPRPPARGDLIASVTREVLDFFGACPRCGYPAQESETVRTFAKGITERIVFRTCGLPCGWFISSASAGDSYPGHRV
ncbi:hypothetical protein AB0H71_06050 [Nocardia sp. NPDC050697]|uniref:hypothetical protein n=1 Tax=Nocardia sp. NPDC050697 TaxID=3155158 RepID=UPI0033E1B466